MKTQPKWQWDEHGAVGGYHASAETAAGYDNHHTSIRDIEGENAYMLGLLNPQPGHRIIDMGAGTGLFTLAAAERYEKVYAVDISPAMFDVARGKVRDAGIDNVEFMEGGFLTYEHESEPVDAVVSVAALHHLPDVWKQVALLRMAEMLKPGGKLCLRDTVFFNMRSDYAAWLDEITTSDSGDPRENLIRHIRDEYTTMDWIMEGMLARAGFSLDEVSYDGKFWANYFCTKETTS